MNSDNIRFPDDILREIRNPELVRQHIREGKSLKDIVGYSDEIMEHFYQTACTLVKNKKYVEAQDAFLFLTTLDPYVYAYWLGLAMAYQVLEEYEQAILSYECAAVLAPEIPVPHFYISGCHLRLRNKFDAQVSIGKAREKAEKSNEYADFMKEVVFAEERINRAK